MNTDRFLTRVFDKQEKKMVYVGDFFLGNDGEELMFLGITLGLAVDEMALIASDVEGYGTHVFIGDRFVPMMCWGEKDKAGKLFYESDIIKHWVEHKNKFVYGIIKWNGDLYIHTLEKPDEYRNAFTFEDTIENACEIIGNKWENPQLLEGKA